MQNPPDPPILSPSAFRAWEDYAVPHLLSEVVEALLALPAGQRSESRITHTPVVMVQAIGTAFGCRFRMVGIQWTDGKWLEVLHVIPLEEWGRLT